MLQSKQSVSHMAVDNEKFTNEVSHQMDANVDSIMENVDTQQSSIQQLNVLLSDNVSASMEVCGTATAALHTPTPLSLVKLYCYQ